MAAKKSTAKSKTEEAPPYAHVLEKSPTNMHERFADWIERNTGAEVDLTSIQLGAVLRSTFQNSEENQEYLAERKRAREAEEAEREEAPARKRKSRKQEVDDDDLEDAEEPEEKPAAKKRAATRRKTSVPPVDPEEGKGRQPAASRRRRPAKKAAAEGDAESGENF